MSKISEKTADTAPTTDDLILTVNDPSGTPASRKVTIANLLKAVGNSLTTYTNNTTALAGGLVAGELYKKDMTGYFVVCVVV